jgi:hypothetical protein
LFFTLQVFEEKDIEMTTELYHIGHRTVSELPVTNASLSIDARAELAFMDAHGGMTREQYAKRERMWAEDDRKAKILEPVDHTEPPESIKVTGKFLPARHRFVKYMMWRQQHAEDIGRLEAERRRLTAMIEAPAQVRTKLSELVKAGARALLGGGETADGAEHAKAQAELADAEYRAQAAKQALADLDAQIGTKQMQHKRLMERENEFLQPAIIEQADTLKQRYIDAVDELRRVLVEMAAARGAKLDVTLPDFWSKAAMCGQDDPLAKYEPWRIRAVTVVSDQLKIKIDKGAEKRWQTWKTGLLTNPTTRRQP